MRKPVRSAVANRKYFQGGGLAPMKPSAPEEAVGIMASSQPLVDMVAQSAGNPQGGMSPLNYNQGGLFSRIFNISQAKADAAERGERERANNAGLLSGTDPRRGALINLDPDQFKKLTQVTMDIPEGKSRIGQILTTKFNLPIQSPLKGIGQFLLSKKMRQDFPTATPVQLQDINAIVRMNPGRENEIYEGAKKLITEQGFKGSGDALRKALIPVLPESLESEKLLDEKFDEEAKKANEKAQKEAEGKAPEIDPIEKTDEFTEIDITTPPGKEGDKLTFPFGKQEETSVAKKSDDAEDKETALDALTKKEQEEVTKIIDQETQVNQSEDPKNAMDETIQNINKNAEEGNQEATTKSVEDYAEEFKKAMPKFEGMTEEEKGFAFMEAGLAIMGGQSPRALENISNGLSNLVKKFTKNKEQERAFNQQINIAAAKYGISKVDQDRQREIALSDQLAKEGRTYAPGRVVLKPFIYKGKKYGKNDFFEFTRSEMETEEFKNIPAGTLASESAFGQIEQSKRQFSINEANIKKAYADFKKEQLGQGIKSSEFDKNMETYQASGEGYYTGLRMRAQLGEAATILMNDPDAILGAKGYLGTMADRALNLAGLNRGELDSIRKGGDLRLFNAKMKQIGTTMLVEILNESTKTISDQDRKRVEELTSQVLRGGDFTKSLKEVQDMMTFLDGQIKKGIISNTTTMNRLERKFEDGLKVKDVDIKTLDPVKQLQGIRDDLTFGFTGRGGQAIKISDIWDPDADGGVGDFKTELSFPKGTQT